MTGRTDVTAEREDLLAGEPQQVFLDTTVFVAAGYNMTSAHLKALEELVAHRALKVVTTDIVVREVHSRIASEVRIALSQLDKLRAKADLRVLRASELSRPLLAEVSVDAIEGEIKAAFDAFLQRTNTFILPTADLPAGPVLADYFEMKPPFGEGTKRKEFPDAFSVAAIQQWRRSEAGEALVVVTGDKGFAEAIDNLDGIECLERLSQVLDAANSEDRLRARFLKREVVKHREELIAWAGDVFFDHGFAMPSGYDGEVVGGMVKSVQMSEDPNDFDIVAISDSRATLATAIDVEIEVQLRRGGYHPQDPEGFYWDDKEESVTVVQNVLFDIEVTFEDRDPNSFAVESVDFPDT